MIIGYIEKLSEYLKEVTKIKIYGLDELEKTVKDNQTKSAPISFIDTNYFLNKNAQKIGTILNMVGKGYVLILKVDGLLHGLNSVLIIWDKAMTFTYYSYAEDKPIKQLISVKL